MPLNNSPSIILGGSFLLCTWLRWKWFSCQSGSRCCCEIALLTPSVMLPKAVRWMRWAHRDVRLPTIGRQRHHKGRTLSNSKWQDSTTPLYDKVRYRAAKGGKRPYSKWILRIVDKTVSAVQPPTWLYCFYIPTGCCVAADAVAPVSYPSPDVSSTVSRVPVEVVGPYL